ncbi:MAG: hypothetical protein COA50_14890 [Flavobacteriaceae bacterium]|nr:MAG: hypothetical protein COA50_14890 [Flavobacteriaceae bacterium]
MPQEIKPIKIFIYATSKYEPCGTISNAIKDYTCFDFATQKQYALSKEYLKIMQEKNNLRHAGWSIYSI